MTPDRSSRATIDRRSFLRTTGAAGAAGAVGLVGARRGQAQAPEMTLRFASLYPPAHSASRTATRFGELVAAKTGRQGQGRPLPQRVPRQRARGGGGGEVGQHRPGLFGPDRLRQLRPGVRRAGDAVSLRHARSGEERRRQDLAAARGPDGSVGLALLGYLYDGPRVTLSTKPLSSIDDFKGLKLRVPQIPLYVQMAQAFGATPTPVALPEVYTALQSRIVEGLEGTPTSLYTQKYHEVAKNLARTDHIFFVAYIAMNGAAPGEAVARPAGGDPRGRPGGQRVQPRDRQAGGPGGLCPPRGGRRQDHDAGPGAVPRRGRPHAREVRRRAWATAVSRSTTRSRP